MALSDPGSGKESRQAENRHILLWWRQTVNSPHG